MAEAAPTFEVVKPGLSTTVQDLGRPGYYHLGLPISGAMDRYALIAANLLVGNQPGDAGLEAVFMGPELRFDADATVAVCGADLAPKVDGVEQPGWTAFPVAAGQTLAFGFLKAGARAYIGISGGIDVPLVLGSRSTYPLGALGGFEGRALKTGDRVAIASAGAPGKPGRSVPQGLRRVPGASPVLRVLPGLYWHRITEVSQAGFFEDGWKVAPEADRIGYRFRGGRKLDFVPREQPFGAGSDPSNIVDSCYPYGSIQVPGGTEPIILHRDAVSGGGYFMIGTVISADMDLVGQLQPHQQARFESVDMDQALAIRAEEATRLRRLKDALAS
ncbi:MAG: biotin-dependent carboxyltransferase [Rhizobiaceae bacterium]|nr:biotin-dependent carboxyltransferase [Rhizobiaceae bacterium]